MPTDNRAPQRAPQRRMIFNPANRFDFDKSKIPPTMSYVWRRMSLAGQEDSENMIMADMNGWTPVPANRHPELSGRHATEKEAIVRGGLMLMEQPKEYAEESRELDNFEARNHLEEQIQRLGLQARRNGVKGGARRSMDQVQGEFVE